MHLFRLFCLGMEFLFWHFSMCLFCRFFVAANVVVVIAVALAVNVVGVGVVIDVDVLVSVGGVNVVVNVFISGNHANVVAAVNGVAVVCNHNLHVLLVCLKCIVLEKKIQLKHKAR